MLLRHFTGELPLSLGIIIFFWNSVTAHSPCFLSQTVIIASHRHGWLLGTQESHCPQLSRPSWNTPGPEAQHGEGDAALLRASAQSPRVRSGF